MKKEITIRFNKMLYNQILNIAEEYNLSINKTVIMLVEKGYFKLIKDEYNE